MRRNAGFTLIEILIVAAIIGVMLAAAVVSVSSGRSAAHARTAARGVAQMSHYANALAILRQRSTVISFSGNKITVQLSGEGGETVEPSVPEEGEDAEPSDEGGAGREEKKGYLYTENVLDPEELAKEDAERSFEGVLFRVELVDENGQALDAQTAAQLRSEADAMVAKRGPAGAAWSNTSGEIDLGAVGGEDTEGPKDRPENDGRIIYETNGNCAPYRVTIFAAAADNVEGEELMTVHVSRSGKVTIGDEEEESRR